MPGHYKKTANKSVRTTVAIYYNNVISFLKWVLKAVLMPLNIFAFASLSIKIVL